VRRLLSLLALAACSPSGDAVETVRGTAVEHGRALFSDPGASPSVSNAFSCATCHPGEGPADRIYSGGSLAGATSRRAFWGGGRVSLLEAINDCRTSFMDARAPWTADDEDARAMWAYLVSRQGPSDPVAFTVVRQAPDLPPGDPVQGEAAFALACRPCHGTIHDGEGRLASFVPRLPDDVNASHASLSSADRRLVFLRKVREGAFVSVAGSMPPFSREALSDADVAGILAYLGQ
jgi:thiosulfate dehydrogenase